MGGKRGFKTKGTFPRETQLEKEYREGRKKKGNPKQKRTTKSL